MYEDATYKMLVAVIIEIISNPVIYWKNTNSEPPC